MSRIEKCVMAVPLLFENGDMRCPSSLKERLYSRKNCFASVNTRKKSLSVGQAAGLPKLWQASGLPHTLQFASSQLLLRFTWRPALVKLLLPEPLKTGVMRGGDSLIRRRIKFSIAAEYSAVVLPVPNWRFTRAKHQWLLDPNMPDWKFPSAPATRGRAVLKVGKDFPGGFQEGDRVSFPGNHASAELLTVGHERCRVWRLPDNLSFEKSGGRCISRYGMGALRASRAHTRPKCGGLGLGIIGQFSLRCLLAAGAGPVVGIDEVKMRRDAALSAGADHVIDPSAPAM